MPDSNSVHIVPIEQLSTYRFFIPSYQRGYRWTQEQVTDLLCDIDTFSPRETEKGNTKTWYCLQPVVVKLRNQDSNEYEVIDGQQRITTLFLIGHYINEMWRGKQKDPELELHYESKITASFLQSLHVDDDGIVPINDLNMDLYHISTAYQTIHNWVASREKFQRDMFIANFLHHVKVIWYQTEQADPVDIFTRINMGKIPLTNAELIKALFLNSSNFQTGDTEKVRLKQLEIAAEWDRMEAALHNQEFWYFLTDNKREFETRIDFLFDLLTDVDEDIDGYAIFREYSMRFKNNDAEEIEKQWCEVKRYFQTLEEWFQDRELYHKVGYLLSTGVSVRKLIQISQQTTKSNFSETLNAKISKTLPNDLEALAYGSKGVRNVLLLHNIQTMLKNIQENSRFPFDRYKMETWDVEHIHAVHTQMPEKDKGQQAWLDTTAQYLAEGDELLESIDRLSAQKEWNREEFEAIFLEAVERFSKDKESISINDISNLALLDSQTNRSYKNAVFPAKRAEIIRRERSGTFVPLCTKNVFMKYYSEEVESVNFWEPNDRNAYREAIADTLEVYYKGGE